MARPQVVGTPTTAVQTNGTTISIPVPSGTQEGDVLAVAIRGQSNAATVDLTNANFTRVGPAFVANSANGRITGWHLKRVTATPEPASYTFTSTSSSNRIVAGMMIIRPASPASPVSATIDVASTDYTGTSTTNGVTAVGLNASANNELALVVGAAEPSAGQAHVPTVLPIGWTNVFAHTSPASGDTGVSRSYIWVGKKDQDAGGTGSAAFAWAANLNGRAAQMIVFKEGDVPDILGHEIGIYNGTDLDTANLYVYDGTDLQPVTDLYRLPPENQQHTIADMLLDTPFYWSHRGGSLNWPEMTMRAYTNSIWWGVKCLEVSVHRSSDGVFIMNHDTDLTRTTAATHVIASTASSTLLGIPVDTPVTGGVIGRLEDLLDTYGQTNVLIIDDKTFTNMTPMLDLIEAHIPDATDRVIIKSYAGTGGNGWAATAKARGFTTWGYIDAGQIGTAVLTNCDMIGMDVNAPSGEWTTAVATGKPVVGYLITNTTQASTAISRGAAGLQVANVTGIIPAINNVF